jgi:hypothetical protein
LYRFDLPHEVTSFNKRNKQVLALLPKLNEALDTVFKKRVTADRQGVTVFFLGRLCVKDFSEILLLSSNGYGFAALQILRGMFEKLVDATYLHNNPNEVDAFWNYYLVQLKKFGLDDVAKKCDVNWEQVIESFKHKTKKGSRTQPRWSTKNLVLMAEEVGLKDFLTSAYYLPNLYVHNSSAEILFAVKTEEDGSMSPADYGTAEEIGMADIAFFQAYLLLLKTMALEVEHYGWDQDEPLVQRCIDDFGERVQLLKKVRAKS